MKKELNSFLYPKDKGTPEYLACRKMYEEGKYQEVLDYIDAMFGYSPHELTRSGIIPLSDHAANALLVISVLDPNKEGEDNE